MLVFDFFFPSLPSSAEHPARAKQRQVCRSIFPPNPTTSLLLPVLHHQLNSSKQASAREEREDHACKTQETEVSLDSFSRSSFSYIPLSLVVRSFEIYKSPRVLRRQGEKKMRGKRLAPPSSRDEIRTLRRREAEENRERDSPLQLPQIPSNISFMP